MPEHDPAADAVRALHALDVPEDVAARHLARLATVRPSVAAAPPPRRRRLRAGIAALVFATTLGTGAGVAAAGPAQPGDTLYGLKTARERLQLALARPGDSRARLELKLARTRLDEAAALLRRGDADRAVETLARADAALASAGAHGAAGVDREVADELAHRVEVLGALLAGGLPPTAADAAREAIDRAVARRGDPGRRPGRPSIRPAPPTRPTPHPTTPHPTGVRPTSRPSPTAPPAQVTTRRPTARPETPAHGRPTARPGRGR